MDEKELQFILQEGESLKIEFKEQFDKSLADDLVAFANSSGGKIFLGVNDRGIVEPVSNINQLKSQVQDLAKNCDPSVEIELESFKNILIITIPEGKDKPYKCKNGFFVRLGPNSQKMTRNQIIEVSVSECKIRFDEQINRKFNFKKDFSAEKFRAYLKKANLTENLSTLEILDNLGVMVDTKINNAGILFFAKTPRYFLMQAEVSCIRFSGVERVDIIDRLNFTGDIIENIDQAIKFVQRNTRTRYEIKAIERKEIPEYPLEAVREAIINAVMHRDYFQTGASVSVDIFDDRLEISNPGGLPKGLDKNNFGKKGVRRNPLIADLLYRVRYVEKAGTGINRIKKSLKEAGLPAPKIEFNGFFTITFFPPEPINEPLNGPLTEPLNGPLTEIINLIKTGQKVNRKLIISKLGLSRTTATRYLLKLKKLGLIDFIGSDKAGYYILKKKT